MLLYRAVATDEVGADGKVFSSAFSPLPDKDKGLLSTEHETRPDGAQGYRNNCGLTDIAAIYAVSIEECTSEDLPCIDDSGEGDNSDWHVSVDFRAHANEVFRLSNSGKRKAKRLAQFARDRKPLA